MSRTALNLCGVSRVYKTRAQTVRVFEDLSFSLRQGEAVALTGPSGAGKSSLLHIAGLLEAPSAGKVFIAGQNTGAISRRRVNRLRCLYIGFVFQAHRLLPELNALENAALPAMIAGCSRRAARARGAESLERLGLAHRFSNRPGELSGGEQQRVAIARALVNKPCLLLADEPTGNLDARTAKAVFADLVTRAHEQNCAVLAATHNMALATTMDRVLILTQGNLQDAESEGEKK